MRFRDDVLAAFVVGGALACAGCGSATNTGVIREWARALTAGDLDKAASYFAVPAIVENGTPPVRVTSRAQARAFNELLPCGARLLSTARHGAYIYAKFRLTNRVGASCAGGAGELAATAFLIRDGKIAQWRRLPDPGSGQQPPGTPTPTTAPSQGPSI